MPPLRLTVTSPLVLRAWPVENDLLTLPLTERLESFLADGDHGLDADAALGA